MTCCSYLGYGGRSYGGVRRGFRRGYKRGGGKVGFHHSRGLYRKKGYSRKVRSTPSALSKALAGFKTGQVLQFSDSTYSYNKSAFGLKQTLFLIGSDGNDNLEVLNAVGDIYGINNLYSCGLRNYKSVLFFKNVSTYAMKVRVCTWVCRRGFTWNPESGPVSDAILNMYFTGLEIPVVNVVGSLPPLNADDVSASPFQNPYWVSHWKCIKKKSYTLMPYRTKTESLTLYKKRPALVQRYVSTADTSAAVSENFGLPVGIAGVGGVRTCVKTIEIVGEVVNDDTAAPNPNVFTSPAVLIFRSMVSFQAAVAQEFASVYGVGDPNPSETVDTALTGQPWNYMFPTPSSSSSIGTSAVIGALASGI